MIKTITSFTQHTTAEGQRISYTYSEIDDDGNVTKSNVRATCIVVDPTIKQKLADINEFLLNRETTLAVNR